MEQAAHRDSVIAHNPHILGHAPPALPAGLEGVGSNHIAAGKDAVNLGMLPE
ncbi:hypothetical protein D3C73_1520330 [compost metagenome]